MDLSQVEVLDFLNSLKIRGVEDEGEEIRFVCPFGDHSTDSARAYMNANTTAWICHKCHARGNAVHFLSKLENISALEAARLIRERYGAGWREPDGGTVAALKALWLKPDVIEWEEINPPIPEYECSHRVRDAWKPEISTAMAYMLTRGFTTETLEDWQIGFDTISNRVSIPVRNTEGKLIGFKARSWREGHMPKYLVLGDKAGYDGKYGFPTYEKSQVIFGLDRAESANLIVVEGELNVIALWQDGIKNAIAINGSQVSSWQRDCILRHAASLTLYFDDDKAGRDCTISAIDMFAPYIPVYVVPEHEGDPASITAEESARLLDEAKSVAEIFLPDN